MICFVLFPLTLCLSSFLILGAMKSNSAVNIQHLIINYTVPNLLDGISHTYSANSPFVADTFYYYKNGTEIVSIISALHLSVDNHILANGTFVIIINGTRYEGKKMLTWDKRCVVMVFHFDRVVTSSTNSITYSLENEAVGLYYRDCVARLLPSKVKGGIATCSYVAKNDTFYEIANFIQYSLASGVDKVILYEGTPIPYMNAIQAYFGKRVSVFNFSWPRRERAHANLDTQVAQVNSCYYRNRDEFKYLIMIDMDEMLFNHSNMTLMDLLDSLFVGEVKYGLQVE